MHPHSAEEAAAIADAQHQVNVRTYLGSTPYMEVGSTAIPPGLITGDDPFESATIAADLDQPVVRGEFEFKLGLGATSLSPYSGVWAAFAERPLIDPGMYIRLDVQVVGLSPGATPASEIPFRPIYIGRIDTVDPASKPGVLQVISRDFMGDLLDKWIEPSPTEGWVMPTLDIFLLLHQLLEIGGRDEWANLGQIADRMTMIGSPELQVPSYIQQPGSLLLAMRQAALLNGWDLRGRWVETGFGEDEYQLTYYEPDRALVGLEAGTALPLGPNRILGYRGFAKSRDEVRNRVLVKPSDPPRAPVYVRDTASELLYGPLFLGLYEDEASRIQTPTQAEALANAILSDLKSPKVMAELDTRLLPFVEINDLLDLLPNEVHTAETMTLAVSGYTHTFQKNGHATTTLQTRDIPAAANKEWRRGQPKTRYVSTELPSGPAVQGAIWEQYA